MTKRFFIALILIEIFLAVVVGMGTCLLRMDLVRAINAAVENPSDATRAELSRQQVISLSYNIGFAGIIFFVLVTPTYLAYRSSGEHHAAGGFGRQKE